jgi:hypothetical protein
VLTAGVIADSPHTDAQLDGKAINIATVTRVTGQGSSRRPTAGLDAA